MTLKRFLLRFVGFTLAFALLLICIQDMLIFPGAAFSFFSPRPQPPQGVQEFKVQSSDGVELVMWDQLGGSRPLLFFHGNGGSMAEFYPIQRWLGRLGFHAYGVDFRGYGASGGWPSETGIERDAEAALEAIAKREGVAPQEVVVVGLSIGNGPAAYLASKVGSRMLVLLSPYANLRELASEELLIGLLSPFLWYDFPVRDYVSELKNSCLVLAHGELDKIIRPTHSTQIARAFPRQEALRYIRVPDAGHNDLIFRGGKQVGDAILSCAATLAESQIR